MAVSHQIDCNTLVGCVSTKTSHGKMAQRPTSRATPPTVTKGVSAIIPAIVNAVLRSYKRYQSRIALNRLSDDQLYDIGLERHNNSYVPRNEYLNRF